MRRFIQLVIRLYQLVISPVLPRACRFYPSCSQYAREAIGKHGTMRGVWLSVRRIGRCHPWHPGGVDLVPERTPSPAER
ncbi:MAG TPA: membrane protein insertion efficiency factor YidD [Candidatus Baltobacteraceae bacterium]|nr:membrane protein insertion efficiency factor YidD [Candidatus Baltobacteraceae bacterium]